MYFIDQKRHETVHLIVLKHERFLLYVTEVLFVYVVVITVIVSINIVWKINDNKYISCTNCT